MVVRRALDLQHVKLRQVVLDDLAAPGEHLAGVDATFDSVGVSSGGMREPEYRRLTFDLTVGIAGVPAAASPGSVFVYVSGQGTDKGETEGGFGQRRSCIGGLESLVNTVPLGPSLPVVGGLSVIAAGPGQDVVALR